jgi:acetyltransferase
MAMRLTRLDYDREMAFMALAADGRLAGVSRIACAPDHRSAEYALIVRSDLEGRGIGSALRRQLIAYAKADGIERLEGMVLADNAPMLDLVRRLGFGIEAVPEEAGVVMSRLEL